LSDEKQIESLLRAIRQWQRPESLIDFGYSHYPKSKVVRVTMMGCCLSADALMYEDTNPKNVDSLLDRLYESLRNNISNKHVDNEISSHEPNFTNVFNVANYKPEHTKPQNN